VFKPIVADTSAADVLGPAIVTVGAEE